MKEQEFWGHTSGASYPRALEQDGVIRMKWNHAGQEHEMALSKRLALGLIQDLAFAITRTEIERKP